MRTAKAAVYEAPNAPFVLREFPVRPAKRGEVLVRVSMSTICRSDIHSYEGRRPNPYPGILEQSRTQQIARRPASQRGSVFP